MKKLIPLFVVVVFTVSFVFAQKAKPTPKPKTPNKVVFAVINDGKTLEPLAKVENGKLLQTVSGGDESAIINAFNTTYYKPKTVYNLIFGGKIDGTSTVISSNANSDCAKNMANVSSKSTKAKLKGFVMALATNIKPTKPSSGLRRLPTAAERGEIEGLVKAEFAKNGVEAKTLKYHNLTAIDTDNDKSPEFIGTYWVAINAKTRALLFFIAEKGNDGKYVIALNKYNEVKQDEVMSGDIKSVDGGVYHEFMLDYLDYNDDGEAEVFTYIEGFEGSSFFAYQKKDGAWQNILESSNYHCGF
jgi:hypothetical protein